MSAKTVKLQYDGKEIELPVLYSTTGEGCIDISQLRAQTGLTTLDPGFGNTASCASKITYVNGEKGVLRYRGIPIETVAEKMTFVETAWLLIYGRLPTMAEMKRFSTRLTNNELLHEGLLHHFDAFPPNGQPMSILSAVVNSLICYSPEIMDTTDEDAMRNAVAAIISKVRTIAAFSYRKAMGLPFVYPDPARSYCENFLHMMFSIPNKPHQPTQEAVKALNLFLMLHADHEQNCSTSTVRIVGSAETNLFSSVASGICALWGKLHGGANVAVFEMLSRLAKGDESVDSFVERVKRKQVRLMGFGHRVYKTFDPRAKILKKAVFDLLETERISDPLIDIALKLEERALNDSYFKERSLYPNVDFYSGMILRALRIPLNMYTVMFAIGRMPGWIAHWRENNEDERRLARPRQLYLGPVETPFVPLELRPDEDS
ncbi:MAG: citrate synthase [Alphaproteobacteria bacterium]|nr:citrate synthase [Alphaproteobacteria bacterium]